MRNVGRSTVFLSICLFFVSDEVCIYYVDKVYPYSSTMWIKFIRKFQLFFAFNYMDKLYPHGRTIRINFIRIVNTYFTCIYESV